MSSIFPFGSLLAADEAKFIALWENQKPDNYPKDQFVKDYHAKQKIAQADQNFLGTRGLTTQGVGELLNEIVAKAKPFFEEQRQAMVALESRGTFKVSGQIVLQQGSEECSFCNGRTPHPDRYTIVNAQTTQSIECPEITLHLIQKHDYFGKPNGPYRIDPAKVCVVLQL